MLLITFWKLTGSAHGETAIDVLSGLSNQS